MSFTAVKIALPGILLCLLAACGGGGGSGGDSSSGGSNSTSTNVSSSSSLASSAATSTASSSSKSANSSASSGSSSAAASSTSSKISSSSSSTSTSSSSSRLLYEGVSLAGAEFGSSAGTYGADYTYPNASEVSYFAGKKMNIVRVPFLWERLQHSLNGDLDSTELGRLDAIVAAATAKKVYVILDPHNYARYNGNLIGGTSVTQANYVDFWNKLSAHYKNNGYVFFALMNEPYSIDATVWLNAANAAIAGIRSQGANNLILVPGISWTGAHSWISSGNSTTMLGVKDSGNNFAFEVHQYFDSDSSGSSDTCSSSTGSDRLSDFTNWLKTNGYKGFLGEFAGGNNSTCQAAVTDALNYMRTNSSVWIGWTWWAAGPWWGTYQFTLEPTNNYTTDAAQMAWLTPYL